jgi:hypothetical protein
VFKLQLLLLFLLEALQQEELPTEQSDLLLMIPLLMCHLLLFSHSSWLQSWQDQGWIPRHHWCRQDASASDPGSTDRSGAVDGKVVVASCIGGGGMSRDCTVVRAWVTGSSIVDNGGVTVAAAAAAVAVAAADGVEVKAALKLPRSKNVVEE